MTEDTSQGLERDPWSLAVELRAELDGMVGRYEELVAEAEREVVRWEASSGSRLELEPHYTQRMLEAAPVTIDDDGSTGVPYRCGYDEQRRLRLQHDGLEAAFRRGREGWVRPGLVLHRPGSILAIELTAPALGALEPRIAYLYAIDAVGRVLAKLELVTAAAQHATEGWWLRSFFREGELVVRSELRSWALDGTPRRAEPEIHHYLHDARGLARIDLQASPTARRRTEYERPPEGVDLERMLAALEDALAGMLPAAIARYAQAQLDPGDPIDSLALQYSDDGSVDLMIGLRRMSDSDRFAALDPFTYWNPAELPHHVSLEQVLAAVQAETPAHPLLEQEIRLVEDGVTHYAWALCRAAARLTSAITALAPALSLTERFVVYATDVHQDQLDENLRLSVPIDLLRAHGVEIPPEEEPAIEAMRRAARIPT